MPRRDLASLALPERYRDMLLPLLRQHVPNAEVWAYGSRVNGDSYDASDLDLVARNPQDLSKSTAGIIDLQDALIASDLPIQVQVVDWARIPESFRDEIEAAYVVVQTEGE
jgi:uncharacterized protein